MAKRKKLSPAQQRERWFTLGEAALAAYAPNAPRCYVCPICLRGFTHRALEQDPPLLTIEHAPPESYGGKALVLTCEPCNTRSGQLTDHHAATAARWQDFNAGDDTAVIRATVRLQGTDAVLAVNATRSGDTGVSMAVVEKATRREHQAAIRQAFERFHPSKTGADGPNLEVSFHGATHSPRLARVTMLKAGYIALFAWLGYRHIARPELGIVRQQLLDPSNELITHFCLWRQNQPRNARAILLLREPQWLRSFAIQMGGYMVFLPRAGDSGLYTRIVERADQVGDSTETVEVQAGIVPWPTRPTFEMDFNRSLAGIEAASEGTK